MRRGVVLGTAVALGVAACGGGGDSGTNPPESRGTIAGSIENGGMGVANVGVALSGGATRSTTTSAAGGYSFTDLVAGGYTVTVTVPAGLQMAAGQSASRAVTVAAGQTTTVDFALVAQVPATVINVSGFAFAPADVTVPAGTRVRWVNGSALLHTVTPNGHSEWTGAELAAGTSFEHVFDAPGTYAYFCTPHRDAGMTGVIRVQ